MGFSQNRKGRINRRGVWMEALEGRLMMDAVLPVVGIVAVDKVGAESGTPGTDTLKFAISRNGAPNGRQVVRLSIKGTAKANQDYTLTLDDGVHPPTAFKGTTVTIPDGQSQVMLTVTPIDDTLAEPAETVVITLGASAKAYTLNSTASSDSATIADNEPVVGVAMQVGTAAEQGSRPGVFRLNRVTTAGDLVVNFKMAGTAKVKKDYVLHAGSAGGTVLNGSATIPAGQNFVDVFVVPVDDALTDPNETVILAVSSAKTYTADGVQGAATMTIVDNEPVVTIAKTKDASEVGAATTGKGVFTISRTGATTTALTVNYGVNAASTAQSGADHAGLSGTVVIPAGKSSVTVEVVPVEDADVEGNESVVVDLAPGSYTIGGVASATMTIADGPVAAQGLLGTVTFTQTTYQDLTVGTAVGMAGQRTSTGTFTSTNGRNGTYTYSTFFGPGQTKTSMLWLVYSGQPTLNTYSMTLTWNSAGARVDSLNGKSISWPSSSSGASGTLDGHDAVLYRTALIDLQGFYKLL